jgi:hypothetical protein
MNTIRLEVDNKYNFYLENIYISSKVYDEENRDVFTNSYSLSFNIPLQDKDANKLFNYLQTNKSSFQNVKFEDCKLYVNEDLLSETITFTLIEVINGGFNCFILLNEYNKIFLFNEDFQNINNNLNNLNIFYNLDLYSGSTTMRNPIPSTLNAKFIMNNNYNYNGTDNYLTINKDLEISEEDLVFNINVGELLRNYLSPSFSNFSNSFTFLDNDYLFKVDNTELNYNTIYNKIINSGTTISGDYINFKYNKDDFGGNNFNYISYSSDSSTYVYQPYNLITDSEESSFFNYTYKYSYFNNDYNNISIYNPITSSTSTNKTFILQTNPIKWVELPLYYQRNNGNELSSKFNFVTVQKGTGRTESIFFNDRKYNTFTIPSYNDYELEFNNNINIRLELERKLHQSNDYDLNNSYPLKANIINNAAIFALGFSNSEYSESIQEVLSFIKNFFYTPVSGTSILYKDELLDDYFDDNILREVDGLIFYKVVYPLVKNGSNQDDINGSGINIIKFYTKKMFDYNDEDLSNSNLIPSTIITGIVRNSSGEILSFNNNIHQPTVPLNFYYLHPKESNIKELKSVFIMYDQSGYIVPEISGSIQKEGFEIHNTGNIGYTAFYDNRFILSFSEINNSFYSMRCIYLVLNNLNNFQYVLSKNLFPELTLSQFLKELCILKRSYLYYDNNLIDLKSLSEPKNYYLLKNYSSLEINKIFEYKNPSSNLDNLTFWITGKDDSNFYSKDLSKDYNVKYTSFFKNSFDKKRIYNSGNTLTEFDTLQLSSPERYNQNRVSYDSDFNKNIDGGRNFYDGHYLFWIPNTTLDDPNNNNNGKSINFINKVGTISEETIFSPKDLFINTAIYDFGQYNVLFGVEYKSKFEATIKIPFHIWKECKNRPILIEDNGVKYLVFEIEQYNITTEICTVKGIKS